MHLIVASMNHRTAPVDVREQYAVSPERLPAALRELKRTRGVLEAVMLSTCNRTEVYAVVGRIERCSAYIREFMGRFCNMPATVFADCMEVAEDEAAVRHLFRVACGLDSIVVGETQILGQVKEAYDVARREGNTGTLLNRLFHQAITVAKRAHAETNINDHAVSVGYAAVELANRQLGSLDGRRALVIGAGKMAALTFKHLVARGVSRVTVANRSQTRAEALAGQFDGGRACTLEDVPALIAAGETDLVISVTSSPDPVLNREQVAGAVRRASGKPLLLIDLAVPRDLDPAIAGLDRVLLYDIDDLKGVVAGNMDIRRKTAARIGTMIEAEAAAYGEWYRQLGVGPVIRLLQERAKTVHENTMDSLLRKLPDLTEREIKVIRKLTKSIANQMLHDPINRIKEMAAGRGGAEAVAMFTEVFALEEALGLLQNKPEVPDRQAVPDRDMQAVPDRDRRAVREPERADEAPLSLGAVSPNI